jgi:hypothetical protein
MISRCTVRPVSRGCCGVVAEYGLPSSVQAQAVDGASPVDTIKQRSQELDALRSQQKRSAETTDCSAKSMPLAIGANSMRRNRDRGSSAWWKSALPEPKRYGRSMMASASCTPR